MADLEITTRSLRRRIDPHARRLAGTPGVPVVLSDGQTWYLAASIEKVRPEFEGDRFIGVTTFRGFPARAEPIVADLIASLADENANGGATPHQIYAAAVALLRAAHNLSAEEATALLTLPAERVVDVVDALRRAINGEVPTHDPVAASIVDQPHPPDLDAEDFDA